MTNEEFIKILEENDYTYELKDGNVVVIGKGCIWLNYLEALPEGVRFQNKGDVWLNDLETLPERVKFQNGASVHLHNLRALPEGTRFKNGGIVWLHSLRTLPDGMKFQNKGYIDLPSLEGMHRYRGRNMEFLYVDRYTMIIESRKLVEKYEICKARYFRGGPIKDMPKCYVACRGGYSAHAETVKEAMEDITFKYTWGTAPYLR